MSRRLPVDVTPMGEADLVECASFMGRRLLFHPHRLHDKTVTDAERLERQVQWLRTDLKHPHTRLFVARTRSSGSIAGWMSWALPKSAVEGGTDARQDRTANLIASHDPERDSSVIPILAADKSNKEKAVFADRPFWTLQNLFVSPQMRGAGVGSSLVQYGLDMVIKEPGSTRLVGLSSSPMARRMYEKFGFRVVSWFEMRGRDLAVDEGGDLVPWIYRWPYMANFWEGKSEEELERLEDVRAYEGPSSLDTSSSTRSRVALQNGSGTPQLA